MRKLKDEQVSRVLSQAEGPGIGVYTHMSAGGCGCYAEVAFQEHFYEGDDEWERRADVSDAYRGVAMEDVHTAGDALRVLRKARLF